MTRHGTRALFWGTGLACAAVFAAVACDKDPVHDDEVPDARLLQPVGQCWTGNTGA